MALKKKPTTGMKDILPAEMEIRNYVINMIRETYGTFGFQSMETPAVEHIENLTGGHGGENEKLIFKILKRGAKLNLETAKEENDLVDGGLRYDLTVPLSRYYSAHENELPAPFKALQMGNVWRADRPQRGRFRQFMQCDIDILGEKSYLAEIELILATTTLLGKLDFDNFTIRINDRRILKGMASYCGFKADGVQDAENAGKAAEESFDEVFIIIDKMDKIGLDGVCEELAENGQSEEAIGKLKEIFDIVGDTESGTDNETKISITNLRKMSEKLEGYLDNDICNELQTIISTVDSAKNASFNIKFDPTLVRGMSYYTGPIFEIAMDEYGGSVGGGGRYDEMIGKFTGKETPACGFSIGFERIVMLLLERGYTIPGTATKKAFLIEKKCDSEKIAEVINQANELRKSGVSVSVMQMKKNKKFQKEQLAADGYEDVEEIFAK